MQKLVTGMTNNKGFTLIEIMVVIVIIGITVGFALIAFGDFGESKRIAFAAEQLVNTLRLGEQKAIIETATLGLRIDSTSYQILQLQYNSQWGPIANKGIFRETYFPQNTLITTKINRHASKGMPAIIINSSGDLTPFTLTFANKKGHQIAVLKGTRNGALIFKMAGIK